MTTNYLFALTMQMIRFTIYDEKIILTRKLLLTEQFHNERVRRLATKHFLAGTQKMFCAIFKSMIDNGFLKENAPDMLAFVYVTPITSLVHLCDREPERKSEALEQIGKFVRHFIDTYKAQ